MNICGIDYSTRAVDVVKLDENTDGASWHHLPLHGADAFERARNVFEAMPGPYSTFWDDVLAIGLEEPRGYNAGALYRVQGAILAGLPPKLLVQPLIPSVWRKTVGLAGNCKKAAVMGRAAMVWEGTWTWPQDACDAYCIALATRTLIQVGAAA